MKEKNQTGEFALCLDNKGYEVSLEVGKLYKVIKDEDALAEGYARIIDESGEDYAFAVNRFHFINLPRKIKQTLQANVKTSKVIAPV